MPAAPEAFFVLGPAGSGKSSVAREIARSRRAAYLDKDAVAGALVDLVLEEHGDDPQTRESNDYYRERVMPSEYRALFDTAASNLRIGSSVVLDAPFATFLKQPRFLVEMAATAQWPSTHLVVVQVRTAPELMRRRIEARGLARDRWKLENWDEFWSRFGEARCEWIGARRIDFANDDNLDVAPLLNALDSSSSDDRRRPPARGPATADLPVSPSSPPEACN